MSDIENEIESVVEEARETFELGNFLRGRSQRVKQIKLYTDEELGARLGGYEVTKKIGPSGLPIPDVRAWGLKGEYADLSLNDELKKKNAKRLKAIEKEVAAILEELDETSLTLELRSVPKVIKKDAHRAAKKALDITGKNIPEALEEEYSDEYDAQILERVVTKVTRGDGAVQHSFTAQDARELQDFLPESEYARLSDAIVELLFRTQISAKAVEDADF